jgi:hypothetical protein
LKTTYLAAALVLLAGPAGAQTVNLGLGSPAVVPLVAIGCPASMTTGATVGACTFNSAAPAQQAPIGDASVSVPASTSTRIWVASALARVLRIVPNNTTCFMEADSTATASAASTPIPGGYVFNLVEPPPTYSVYAFCTTATTIAVSQGN